jgi:L-alanine-DL-glutamate epimerase-like enolase superfamily enzyme
MTVVTDLEVLAIRLSFPEPVRFGRDHITGRVAALVRLIDANGLVGLGEATEPPHPDAVATARSWAVGREPADLLASGGAWLLGVLPHRLCGALDGACVDLVARQAGLTAAHIIGDQEGRPAVRVNGLVAAAGPGDEPAGMASDLVHQGFDTIKVKLDGAHDGAPAAWWTDTIGGVRSAVGPGTALRVDLNGVLDPDAAESWLVTLRDLDLEYVEQPIAPDHGPSVLARLRESGVPIAPDEAVTDLGTALDLLEAGCDALVIKPARVGGPVRARSIALAASESGVPATISTLYETGVGLATALHVAATLPGDQAHGLATAHLLAEDPAVGLPQVHEGRIAVVGPGIGVSLG